MPGVVEIRNLRNIVKLRFPIPDRGVWLLTAGNGAGKTSLLACIRRIGYANAFPAHFPVSLKSDRLDNHSSGSITYEIGDDKVEYAYRGERWTPRPRSHANLLARFGYPSVTYMGATAERITPRPEDFEPQRVKAAHPGIVSAANRIFDTNKFSQLRTVNLAPGVGNDTFVLSIGGRPPSYHSEKNFSLGELCVLKLLRHIHAVPNNSLIIVDELEMAVHPRAQVKLLEYLQEESKKKNLTVIFSTHSVTLLKIAETKKIIYLERQLDGEIKPIFGCYPTYAIGNIASEEESLPDGVIYVEDSFARDVVSALFDQFADERYDDPSVRPTVKILPIGGFQEVVAFLERNRAILPDRCRQRALLDGDVADEVLDEWKRANNPRLAIFQRMHQKIAHLPWAPEVGVADFFHDNLVIAEQGIKDRFRDNQIHVSGIVRGYDTMLAGPARRRDAKRVMSEIVETIHIRTGRSKDHIQDEICREFAKLSWNNIRADFIRVFAPVVA
nr:AAA family ATPase [Brevundimonas diminuta]